MRGTKHQTGQDPARPVATPIRSTLNSSEELPEQSDKAFVFALTRKSTLPHSLPQVPDEKLAATQQPHRSPKLRTRKEPDSLAPGECQRPCLYIYTHIDTVPIYMAVTNAHMM